MLTSIFCLYVTKKVKNKKMLCDSHALIFRFIGSSFYSVSVVNGSPNKPNQITRILELPICIHGHPQPKPKPIIHAGPSPPTSYTHRQTHFQFTHPNPSASLLRRPSLFRRCCRRGLHWPEPRRLCSTHQPDPRLQRVRVGQSRQKPLS